MKSTHNFILTLLLGSLFLINESCYAQMTAELAPAYYDDYNISYFGGRDGYIDLTVTGGVPPFTCKWSNGSLDQDQYDLAAGYYRVEVWDNHGNNTSAEITLIEPGPDFNSSSPCNGTITPDWSGYTSPPYIYSCPSIRVAIGTYAISPNNMRFSVYGNSYFNGKVGIGDSYIPSAYQVAIKGKLICEEVFVKLRGQWPDYVFDRNYELMPLSELKKYIEVNNHLPGLESSAEVNQSGGFSLGETNALLLKKIEELTLYVISQDEKITLLQNQLKGDQGK